MGWVRLGAEAGPKKKMKMTAGGLGRLRDAHKIIPRALAWVPA